MERNLYLIEDGGQRWFVAAESYEAALGLWRNEHPGAGRIEPDEMALMADAPEVLIQWEENR